MAKLVIEQRFETPMSTEAIDALARQVDPCLNEHGALWMRSYLSADRKRMICEFEAADAESVRASYRAAGVAFEACWVADGRASPIQGM